MSGNVLEWTHSLKKPYPYNIKDGREDENASGFRVLRGGSFINDDGIARCAYRVDYVIVDFGGSIGFRVVVASHASLFFEGFKGLPLCRMPEVLSVHGRKPWRNRRDSAVMPWLGVFLFHQWAVEEGWGGRSGKNKRGSRFAWRTMTIPA